MGKTYMATWLERPLADRKSDFEKFKILYPGCIPIVVDRAPTANANETPLIEKHRFSIPTTNTETIVQVDPITLEESRISMDRITTLMHLTVILRRRMALKKDQSLFLLTLDGLMYDVNCPTAEVYAQKKGEDGFLYVQYALESTLGL